MDVNGKVALVTGGAKRLGRAFALALADAGADVVIHFGQAELEAKETADEVQHRGVRAAILRADLSDAKAAGDILKRAAEFGRTPEILVNSAAVFEPGTVRDTSLENWERHVAINLRAPFLLTQAFAAALGDRSGKVVNVADWRAAFPGRAHFAYTIAKAGLLTLTEMAAQELAPRVQVNALALGAVLPPAGRDATYVENLVQRIPAARPARLDELGHALLFLLENDYVTGETLFLDGGTHLMHG